MTEKLINYKKIEFIFKLRNNYFYVHIYSDDVLFTEIKQKVLAYISSTMYEPHFYKLKKKILKQPNIMMFMKV